MKNSIKRLSQNHASEVLPFLVALNYNKIPANVLKERYLEMQKHNHYETYGLFLEKKLIGIAGLWYCTRHYSGKSAELDHFIISENYRNKNLGSYFLEHLESIVTKKGVISLELNTYVRNVASHKFYFNQGYQILGYHFVKNINN